MADENEQIAVMAKKMRRHLRIYPEAAYIAKGVARWWLQRQHDEGTVEPVAKALERSLREGVVIQTVNRNKGNSTYRRRRTNKPAVGRRNNETLHREERFVLVADDRVFLDMRWRACPFRSCNF